MDNVAHNLIEHDLKNCFKTFGIEGTEQKFIENYKSNPTIQEQYLEVYREILNGKRAI